MTDSAQPQRCTCWGIPSRIRSRPSCTTPCTGGRACRGPTVWPTARPRTRRRRFWTRATSCPSTSPRPTSRMPTGRQRPGRRRPARAGGQRARAQRRRPHRVQHGRPGVRGVPGADGRELRGKARDRVRNRAHGPVPSCTHARRPAPTWSCCSARQGARAARARGLRQPFRASGHRHRRPARRAAASSQLPCGLRAHDVQVRQLRDVDQGAVVVGPRDQRHAARHAPRTTRRLSTAGCSGRPKRCSTPCTGTGRRLWSAARRRRGARSTTAAACWSRRPWPRWASCAT